MNMPIHHAGTFAFELVSPERKLIAEDIAMAVIPGVEGELGVLRGHSPLIAALKPGVVQIYANDSSPPRRVFIAGGFADVTAERTIVLAEEAVNVADLNRGELEQTVRNLSDDLLVAKDEIEKQRIERRLAANRAKLEAVTGHVKGSEQV